MIGILIRLRELREFSRSILVYSMVCLVLMGVFFLVMGGVPFRISWLHRLITWVNNFFLIATPLLELVPCYYPNRLL